MAESIDRGDFLGNVMRQSSGRALGPLKTTLSGRSNTRNSPSFRRLGSSRTPRRDSKASFGKFQWVRNNKVVLWLMLITLWAYIGFAVQSKWAHNDHSKAEFIGYESKTSISENEDGKVTQDFVHSNGTASSTEKRVLVGKDKHLESKNFGVRLVGQGKQASSNQMSVKKKNKRTRKTPPKPKVVAMENRTGEVNEGLIPRRNTSYGLIVGPFGKTEDSVLGWSAEKRKGTCYRKGEFARLVWSRSFLLIFHELSMTGAPLSMMELATEILSCGGTVSVVALSKKGGLMAELDRRGIKVLKDKGELSFKTAMKADLVIAGSAVCSSWIEQYLVRFPAGSNQLVWWIMENRREYFNRSKSMLNRVKMLTFLSDSQSKQWLAWCEEDHIQLKSQPSIVPLSVNDELAFVAGIPSSLNTPASSVEMMLEKRDLLRTTVRKEMGLTDADMLVMTLSSINPGKGQRLLLESALLVAEHNVSIEDLKMNVTRLNELFEVAPQNTSVLDNGLNQETLSLRTNQSNKLTEGRRRKRRHLITSILSLAKHNKTSAQKEQAGLRRLLLETEGSGGQNLKVLIGSIGSKSNKELYIKAILRFISLHPNLSKSVLWTPSTTRVASLYAAADAYVINAQGPGETFGRVTIEAMAFGLPVLGTDAGGTQEIVEHGVTGLLHPLGRDGMKGLAQHIQYFLSNPSVRKKMGTRGRLKVQAAYLKQHMYAKLAKVLTKCMKIK
ncbi:hypothetical protein J5N97_001623 [Dioscorea zingiberensis]|uniref:Glycosyl transferase family 1 domain-containing protein n=1 Tax=Dioscorea zingiberensis TaxID=325984 RepID=A0A9D5BTQ7_9LILI|nr:hypothetical protein J5N97_001623 [Dioscorea zingiberensis]